MNKLLKPFGCFHTNKLPPRRYRTITLIKHTDMTDFDKLILEEKPTLVDFFATWCGPCQMQAPILEETKKRVGENANIIKIDIDQNRRLAAQYNVRSVPTLIIFKKGEAVWREAGLQQADVLERKLKEHYGTKSDE